MDQDASLSIVNDIAAEYFEGGVGADEVLRVWMQREAEQWHETLRAVEADAYQTKRDELEAALRIRLHELKAMLNQLGEVMREATPRIRQAVEDGALLGKDGWIYPMYLHFTELTYLRSLSAEKVGEYFESHYEQNEGAELRRLQDDLAALHYFQDFRPVIEQLFEAYRQGHYAITVAPMISLFERSLRYFWPSENFFEPDVRLFVKKYKDDIEKRFGADSITYALWSSTVHFIVWLYRGYKGQPDTHQRTYRHGIMHGTHAPSNSKREALRFFHAMNTMMSIFTHDLHREADTAQQPLISPT